ncbi:MAG: hypothetical protein JWR90_3298 [Marmoricola sp.]|nr:hypothetical protein [Marmoricola sp.]
MVAAAATTITLAQPKEQVWSGLYEYLGATITGAGTSTVRLLDGSTVLDTKENVNLADGGTTFTYHIYDTEPGTHHLTAEIVGSETAESATSEPVTLVVTKAPSYIGVFKGPTPTLGSPATISVFSRGGGAEGTLRLVDEDGAVLATATMTALGATLTWTPTTAGSTSLKVTLTPDEDSNYLPTSEVLTVQTAPGYASEPTMKWTPVPVAGSTALTVTFPKSTPPVSGSVTLRDPFSGDTLGYATLDAGVAVIPVYAANRTFNSLQLVYNGDANHYNSTFWSPGVTIPAHVTTTVLDPIAETLPAKATLRLSARTTSATTGFAVEGTIVFTINGTDLPALTVSSSGQAGTSYQTTRPGPVKVSARYVPTNPIFAASAAAEVTTTVSDLDPPQVQLSTEDSPVAGKPFTLRVNASRFGFYIADGSTLTIGDVDGNLVGTGTWSSTVFGTSANVTVTPRKGGADVFTARYVYGDGLNGASAPLTKSVAGTPTKLSLTTTTTKPVAGLPIFFTATFDPSATPALDAGEMTLQLNANGVPVGEPIKLLKWQRSVPITVIADRRGTVTYSVTTTGDGASFAAGTAYLQVTPEGSAPMLTTLSDSVVKGRTWKSQTTLTGQPGLPAPTGLVHLSLTDETGMTYGCSFEMPGTGCSISTIFVPRGTYTITSEYLGDSFYKPERTTGYGSRPTTLTVYSSQSTIRLKVTPNGTRYGWQVGEQVTATWTAFDPHNDTTPSGSVAITFGARIVCSAAAAAAACTFTAPENPRAGDVNQWLSSPVDATYTPDEALPSTDQVAVQGPRRCLPVTSSIDSSYEIQMNTPAPGLTGTACTTPGLPGALGATGFLEGTEVTVALPKVPAGYKVKQWHLEANNRGEDRGNFSNEALTFTVSGATTVSARIMWEPTCVTVTAADQARVRQFKQYGDLSKFPDYYDFGWVDLKTPSNCSSPYGQMSVPEWKDFQLGIGHYAVGTDVQAMPYAHRVWKPTAWNAQYKAIGIETFDLPDATHEFPHAVVTEDRYISGDFVLDPSMCTPVKLYAGIGGKLNVLSSKKSFRYFGANESGRCYTETGQAGYYAFTTIETKATPDSPRTREGHFQNRWFDGDELSTPASRAENLKDQAVGEYPAYSDPDLYYSSDPSTKKFLLDTYGPRNNYNPQFHGYKVPVRTYDADVADMGVGFAEVRCMKLNLSIAVPVKAFYDRRGPKVEVTAPNCGSRGGYGYGDNAAPERGQSAEGYRPGVEYKGQMVRHYDGTGLYITGTQVTASVAETSIRAGAAWAGGPLDRATGDDFSLIPGSAPRNLVMALAASAEMTGVKETKGESKLSVTMTGDQWVRGSYVPENCRTPYVKVRPSGVGGYSLDPKSSGSCPDGKSDPKLQVVLESRYTPDKPDLQAVWSMGQQRENDFSEVPDQAGYERTSKGPYVVSRDFRYNDTMAKYNANVHMVELFYCGKLNVGMSLTDRNGNAIDWRDREAMGLSTYGLDPAKYLANGGACPATLMALPGSTAQVGLNAAGARKFEFKSAYVSNVKIPTGQVPSARVNTDGTSPDRLTIAVKPRCFTLTLGAKVAPATMPTCPGAVEGQWEYLPGTPVVVKFTGNEADTFKGWNGIDKEDGKVAAVIMNQDRDVSAKFSSASGLELAVKIVSNIEQRVVSALITAATGAVASFLFVAQLAALAVVGIAEGLQAMGVNGEGIDRMMDGAKAIQSGIDVVNSLSDCTQEWATGGGAPPFSPGSDYADQGVSGGGDLIGYQLDKYDTRASGAGGALLTGYSMTMMFATGIEAYLQEPAEAWSNIVDIGSCVADRGRAAGDAAVQLGHR